MPLLLTSVISGCNKKKESKPIASDSILPSSDSIIPSSDSIIPSSDSSSPSPSSSIDEGLKDEFVKLDGETAKTAYNKLMAADELMDDYEGSYTSIQKNSDSNRYITYDSATKRYLNIRESEEGQTRTIISNIEKDPVVGILYRDEFDKDGNLKTDSPFYVRASLDYSHYLTNMESEMALPPYEATLKLNNHKDLYCKAMFIEFSEMMGVSLVSNGDATLESGVYENKIQERYAFSLKTSGTAYMDGDSDKKTVLKMDMEIYMEGSEDFVYVTRNKMDVTMYMGTEPMSQTMISENINSKEFDAKTYNEFVYNLEKPEIVSSYYSNDLVIYYKDLEYNLMTKSYEPGAKVDLATLKQEIENRYPGFAIDKIYYDKEHTRAFNGITSLYDYRLDLYISGGPKADYVEVEQEFVTTYIHTDNIDLSKYLTPEEIAIINELSDSSTEENQVTHRINSYFYLKSAVSANNVPIEFSSSPYYSSLYSEVYLDNSTSLYKKSYIAYEASKNIYNVTLKRTVTDGRDGSGVKYALHLIEECGDYDKVGNALHVDLGHLRKNNSVYFSLDTSKYDFWGKEVHFFSLNDKSNYSEGFTALSTTSDLKFECFYFDKETQKDLVFENPDVYDVPSGVTVYFKITALEDLPTFAIMQLL